MSVVEDLLVRCCSPTLAGIKTASLFTVESGDRAKLAEKLRELNCRLSGYGLKLLLLRFREKKALVYVYLPQLLKEHLSRSDVSTLLSSFGYPCSSPGKRLAFLHRRLLACGEFPHEIGLFLGYPAEDVDGFIRQGAKNCKCCGYWKVYGDEAFARRQFTRFHRCTDCCCALWRQGMSIEEILDRKALIA